MHSKSPLFLSLVLICEINIIIEINSSEIDSLIALHDRVKDTLVQVLINGKCDEPKPTIVYVNDSTSKTYLPRATILHRCSDQFSCCPNPKHSCRAVGQEEVDIGFYTLTKGDDGFTERGIEILQFINHTKCGCIRSNQTLVKDILLTLDSSGNKKISDEKNDVIEKANDELINNKGINNLHKNIVTQHNKSIIEVNIDNKNTTISSTTNISTTVLPEKKLLNPKNDTNSKNIETDKNESSRTNYPFNLTKNFSTTIKPLMTIPAESSGLNITIEKFTEISNTKSTTLFTPTFTTTKSTKFLTSLKTVNQATSPTKPIGSTTETYIKSSSTTPSSKTWSSTTSTINYDELEREEDLNPKKDVVYNGVNFLYTKSIVVLPRTTPSFRFWPTIHSSCG